MAKAKVIRGGKAWPALLEIFKAKTLKRFKPMRGIII
jgi:hypothetical protein